MSKVNPVSASASTSSLEVKRTRRKVSRVRLPTPPPDPTIGEEPSQGLPDKEAEFIEYLESLQRNPPPPPPHPALSRSASTFAPAIAAEDAFDHLDKLYKLMEQMLTLREQNVILHRRIMDLERLRNVQDMHRQLDTAEKLEEVPDYDPDSMFAESFLDNILTGTKKDTKQKPVRFRQSILRKPQRLRSQPSVIEKDERSAECVYERRVSMAPSGPGDKPSKVSKWTKVKAAFKWEKASPTVSDAKSQDSGLGGMQPVNYEVARYLRVPSTSEELGTSPADSGAAEISTPATISSASSAEELHRHARRRTQEDTSDEDQLFSFDYIPINKDEPSTSSNKSTKSHRTPWAKMKDIIQTQTRNSFKKKHRLSTKSDDFKVDGSIGSDNEEVFENDEHKSPILIIQSPEEINKENQALSLEHSIPVDIIARYRVISDDCNERDQHGRLISKWSKVKKAFLSSPSISRNESNSPIQNSTDFPAIRRDAHPTKESDERLHAEIQRNYLELQKKLSQEFQEKLQEWERSKLSSPTVSISSNTQMNLSQDEGKDLAFKKKMEEWERIKSQQRQGGAQLQSEENLPPEFRKKLQEWKKIKKSSMKEESGGVAGGKKKNHEWARWRSVSAHRAEQAIDNQQLSDDFLKKYESWKQIKSAGASPAEEPESRGSFKGNKTPSPRMSRKDGGGNRESKKIKDQTDKELQWFEKELGKIEREKQRLERDRQKFLDREERLAKLRRSVVGGNKKEILVHTPSGFYRFEGISRKFTRKLYEWEKAQGIRPEASTFALLKSSCIPHICSDKNDLASGPLVRSKSADSIMNPETAPVCPLMSQQPSSLSLNDVANLEQGMMLQSSSVPDIIRSNEVDSEEPEAIIVEVEDVVEETASLLENFLEKHTPIYQKQENINMCEGETRAAPTIRRSESARAQANYNLIEEVIVALRRLADNENDIEGIEYSKMNSDSIIIINSDDDDDVQTLKAKQAQQKEHSGQLLEKLVMLQGANANVASDITKEGTQYTHSRLGDVLDTIQDLSAEVFNLAETIDRNIYKRNKNQMESDTINSSKQMYPQIFESLTLINNKILELRRNLSYICAASDMSVSSWKKKYERAPHHAPLRKMPSIERKRAVFRKSRSKEGSQEAQREEADVHERKYEKNNSPKSDISRQVEQGAIKKRIRYRQKGSLSKTVDETDDDEEEFVAERKPKPRRVRSQNSSESNKSLNDKVVHEKDTKRDEIGREGSVIIVDPDVVEKVVVPTKTTNFLNFEENVHSEHQDSPVTVFVKTTRKLFTPIASTPSTPDVGENKNLETPPPFIMVMPPLEQAQITTNRLPPVPASPVPQRKIPKEISPNIRLMMVKYNQKIFEETGTPKSAGSSGSASPVAWRSPVFERRVKAQTERYQQELQKMSPLLGGRREVQKSASMGVVVSGNKQLTIHGRPDASPDDSPKVSRGILKSSSAGVLQTKNECQMRFKPIIEDICEIQYKPPSSNTSLSTISDTRSSRIQRAKEEFLNWRPSSSQCLLRKNTNESIKYTAKNRLSQISVESESSCTSSAYEGVLMKSASAGMINIDPDVYKQFDPEIHKDGYVSLPRVTKKNKEGLLSNITSKFRKVKMRRHKDASKMNAVSTLCRQSLVVDIHTDGSQENISERQASRLSIPADSRASSSTETSPSTSRSSSWIRRPRLFRSKQ